MAHIMFACYHSYDDRYQIRGIEMSVSECPPDGWYGRQSINSSSEEFLLASNGCVLDQDWIMHRYNDRHRLWIEHGPNSRSHLCLQVQGNISSLASFLLYIGPKGLDTIRLRAHMSRERRTREHFFGDRTVPLICCAFIFSHIRIWTWPSRRPSNKTHTVSCMSTAIVRRHGHSLDTNNLMNPSAPNLTAAECRQSEELNNHMMNCLR